LRVEIGMKREMQIVNVTELQTDLITWLERVRAGEEALVSDLNLSFAKTSSVFSFNNLGKPNITC
jgi:hypothetical protein